MPLQQLSSLPPHGGRFAFFCRASIVSLTLACQPPCPVAFMSLRWPGRGCAGCLPSPGVECRRGVAAAMDVVVAAPWWWLPWLRTVRRPQLWCSCSHLQPAPIGWAGAACPKRVCGSRSRHRAWRPLDGLPPAALSVTILLLPVTAASRPLGCSSTARCQCPSHHLAAEPPYDAERLSLPACVGRPCLNAYASFSSQLVCSVSVLPSESRRSTPKHLDRLDDRHVSCADPFPTLMLADRRRRGTGPGASPGLWWERSGVCRVLCCLPGRIAATPELGSCITTALAMRLSLMRAKKEGIRSFLRSLESPSGWQGGRLLAATASWLGGNPLVGNALPHSGCWWTLQHPWPTSCVPCWKRCSSRVVSLIPLRPVRVRVCLVADIVCPAFYLAPR